MFDALRRFLAGVDDAHRTSGRDDAAFALAVLLIDVARSDDDRMVDREHRVIERVLAARFGLEPSEVTRLITAAEAGAIRANRLVSFHAGGQKFPRGRTCWRDRDVVGSGLFGWRPDRRSGHTDPPGCRVDRCVGSRAR